MSDNGWEEYRLLVKTHIESEEKWQARIERRLTDIDDSIEERLDKLETRLASHLGGARVLSVVVPFVISVAVSLAALWLGR
jgi:hypothetical protein